MGFWSELFGIESEEDKESKLYYEIYTLCKNCGQKETYKILKGKKAEEELVGIQCKNCGNKSLKKTEEQSLLAFINENGEMDITI